METVLRSWGRVLNRILWIPDSGGIAYRRARLLQFIALGLFLAVIAYGIVSAFYPTRLLEWVSIIVACVAAVITIGLNRYGYSRVAAIFLLLAYTGAVSLEWVTFPSNAAFLYIFSIVVAGSVMESWGVLFFTVLCVGCTIAAALHPAIDYELIDSVMSILFMLIIALIAGFNARNMEELTEELQRDKQYLEDAIEKYLHFVKRVREGDHDARLSIGDDDQIEQLSQLLNELVAYLQEVLETERRIKDNLQEKVSEYVTFVNQVAHGDLTGRLDVTTTDELGILGYNLTGMAIGLHSLAAEIKDAANAISGAATEIMSTTSQQAASTTEQSVAISQTTATISEVKHIAEQSIDRAREVESMYQETMEISQSGLRAAAVAIDGMSRIKGRVESIAESILALSEQTQQIGEIIDTVDDIAEQSTILALNASVEAARAGEMGAGFAVVAREVRALAEQSSQATAQVSNILGDIQRSTNAAVMITEEGMKGVDEGVLLTGQASDSIRELSARIEQSAQAAMQIVASAQQQTGGLEQVALAMENISQATRQTVESVHQAEEATRGMNDLSQRLQNIADQYKL